MQFTSVILATLIAFVAAEDYRELFKFNAADGAREYRASSFSSLQLLFSLTLRADLSLSQFLSLSSIACTQWTNACQNYKSPGLSHHGELCEAGDYHGQNTADEAKVFCHFTDSNGNAVYVTDQVAASIGATSE